MTVSSETRTAGPFTGNGVTTAFPFAFRVFTGADVLVVQTDVSGAETELALTTDYTVTLNGDQDDNPGGTVTLNSALTTGYLLTLTSEVAYTQLTELTNGGGFYPQVITAALDKLAVLIQQARNLTTRSIKIPLSDGTGGVTELPTKTLRASSVFSFDADGDVETLSLADLAASLGVVTGNVPSPTTNDVGDLLRASGAGTYAWWGGTDTVASAATVDLANSKPYVTITGSVTITSLGSPFVAGELRTVRFSGVLTLTHGATLVLPTGASIVTAAEDVAIFVSRGGASGWRCVSYQRVSGAPLVLADGQVSTAAKIADAIITYAKMAAAAIASTADIVAGTASKLVDAAGMAPLFYSCSLYKAAVQSLTNNTIVALTFDSENYDDAGWHSTSVNPTRVTVDFDGRVRLTGEATITPTAAAVMRLYLYKNGSQVGTNVNWYHATGSNAYTLQIDHTVACVAGDYFELMAFQNSGSAADATPYLEARRAK
jgi:hypothetical protein